MRHRIMTEGWVSFHIGRREKPPSDFKERFFCTGPIRGEACARTSSVTAVPPMPLEVRFSAEKNRQLNIPLPVLDAKIKVLQNI